MEVHWEQTALAGGWPGCGFPCGGATTQQHAEAEATALMRELECELACGLQDDGPDEVAAACGIITGSMAFKVDVDAGCGLPAAAQRTPEHSSCGGCSPRNSCDTTGAVLSPQQQQQLWPHPQQLPGTSVGYLGMMVPQYPCGSGTGSGTGATTTTASYPGCCGSLVPQLSGYMVPAGAAAPLPTYDAATGSRQLISSSSSSFLAGPSAGVPVATTGAPRRTPAASDVPIASGGVAKKGSKKAPSKRGDAQARRSDGGSSKSASGAATDPAAASDDDCKPRRGGRAAATAAAAAAAPNGSASKAEARSSGSATGSASSQAALIRELQAEVAALTASKAQLRSQLQTVLNSHADVLSRVATLTQKWQAAVAENAALQRQNLALCNGGNTGGAC